MNSAWFGCLALVSAGLVLGQPGTALADEPSLSEQAEMGKKFQGSCVHCHQPPDLRFATDRAWLRQVKDTA